MSKWTVIGMTIVTSNGYSSAKTVLTTLGIMDIRHSLYKKSFELLLSEVMEDLKSQISADRLEAEVEEEKV